MSLSPEAKTSLSTSHGHHVPGPGSPGGRQMHSPSRAASSLVSPSCSALCLGSSGSSGAKLTTCPEIILLKEPLVRCNEALPSEAPSVDFVCRAGDHPLLLRDCERGPGALSLLPPFTGLFAPGSCLLRVCSSGSPRLPVPHLSPLWVTHECTLEGA